VLQDKVNVLPVQIVLVHGQHVPLHANLLIKEHSLLLNLSQDQERPVLQQLIVLSVKEGA
jgi:hypothetical protein